MTTPTAPIVDAGDLWANDSPGAPIPLATAGALVAVTAGVGVGLYAAGVVGPAALLPLLAVLGLFGVFLVSWRVEYVLLTAVALRPIVDFAAERPDQVGGSQNLASTGSLSPGAVIGILTAGAVAAWWLAERPSLGPVARRLAYGGGAFVVVVAMGALASGGGGTRIALRIISGLVPLMGLMVMAELDRLRWRQILTAVLAGLTVPVVVALIQAATGEGVVTGDATRVYGTMVHPNSLGGALAVSIPVAAAMAWSSRVPWQRLAATFWLPLAGLALVFTFARVAWAAAAVAILVVALLQRRWLVVIVLPLILGGVLLFTPSVTDRLENAADTEVGDPESSSLAFRFEHWQDIMTLPKGSDWVFGTGLESVRSDSDARIAPHNDYLRVGVELGLIGAIALLAFGWALFSSVAWGRRRTIARSTERAVCDGAYGALAAAMVFAITDNLLPQTVVMWPLGAFIAAAVAAGRDRDRLASALRRRSGAVPAGISSPST